jgi:hypothetical protein
VVCSSLQLCAVVSHFNRGGSNRRQKVRFLAVENGNNINRINDLVDIPTVSGMVGAITSDREYRL